MNKGILAGTGPSRPSFLRHLIGLYRNDAAFRGLVDFTAIGVVVLIFLQFFPTKDGKYLREQAATQTTPATPAKKEPLPARPDTPAKKEAPPTPATAEPAKVAIQFPRALSNPTLGPTRLFEIDEGSFRSSAPADQPRLAAATRAARAQAFEEIAGLLAPANAADPNVAFLRGIGLIAGGTEDNNKAAEQAWRRAADAGHRKAALQLARLQVYAPPGIAKNVEQGRRAIEEAAAAGDREAQRMAGIGYLSGQFGVDPGKAREFLRQAAQAGDVPAMLFYSFTLGWAIGGPADQSGAVDYLRRAAAAGLTLAQQTLGIFLLEEYKQKVIDDPREGVEWLEKATRSGYSIFALRPLALFLGKQEQPPWNDKAKLYDLVRLCSGIKDGWCQAENGWIFHYGVGTKRDFVKAFAHYQVAIELGYPGAAKSIEEPSKQLSAADKTAAIELSQKINAGLKPVPAIWDLQYVGVVPPSSRWGAAEHAAAPPITSPQAVAIPQTTSSAATGACSKVMFRQFADVCNNCTAPPWNGELNRTSADEWTATFVDGHNRPGSSRWRLMLQTSSEILLYDASRDRYARVDLGARKGSQRSGSTGTWTPMFDILSTDCR
jgi:TPR repeat protein